MTEAIFRERLQAIIDWADLAMKNRAEFDSHGVRNLDGPVFDAAREALAAAPAPAVKPLVSAPANPSGREETDSAKIDGVLRKLEALRIAFDMRGANATTILRVVNTLGTMKNAMAAIELELIDTQTANRCMTEDHAAAKAQISALQARIQGMENERRMIVSHATMGQTDGEGLSVNDVSVRITQLRNELYRAALNKDEKHHG